MSTRRHTAEGVYLSFFVTGFGVGAVTASGNGLLEIFLPFGGETAEDQSARILEQYSHVRGESPMTRHAADLLVRYFSGERVVFDLPVDQSAFTPFQIKVYRAVMGIPYGAVKSYGTIAVQIGKPQAARGIGGAMARNPLPIIIPCHRVVGSSGALTGYSASGGIASKRWLLEMERDNSENMAKNQGDQ
jgi:methylated-DNA-[protein]-cysteine S-methyltransferase